MINVGDRFRLNNKNWEVIFIDNNSVVVARSENGEERIVSQRTIYKDWYEQQKQRVDECCKVIDNLGRCAKLQEEKIDRLEKRWSELRARLIKTCKSDRTVAKQYSRSFLCLLDELEGKENVFETVQQLEEDNNDI
ncbi:hypothetical protein [Macrococcoides canis]|uniref:hypothetical protein n=1 Tax=Macrococcoides canis TaxID=1855823 RepID=UPI0020B84B22|nr:hypothetical protein [Macrococcus canis]UTH07946.1 hypothetical protein KFV07_05905 [Macrococcus canis]